MLEIAGGILLAVAILAMLVVAFRFVVLALSAVVFIAITVGVWLLLASGVGQWSAAAILAAGFAIWFWSANRNSPAEKMPDIRAPKIEGSFGQKIP